MKKSIWIRIVAMLLVIVLTGCSTPTMGPVDSQPQTDSSSTTSTNGQENETTDSTDATENTKDPADPTTSTEPTEDNPSGLDNTQLNSIRMLNYLTVLSQEINSSNNSRLFLESAYSSLINNTYPNAVDVRTEAHLEDLLDTLENFRMLTVKKERLEYIYEKNRAKALQAAIPNPVGLLSAVQSGSALKAAISVVYMAVDSYSSYTAYTEETDLQYLQDGWELDDAAATEVHNTRTMTFSYMLDMVRNNDLPGDYVLSEQAVADFVSWKNNSNISRRIRFFESNQATYQAFGEYWLTLAESYYENGDYEKCINAVHSYEDINARIFRKDYGYAKVLPLVIVSAREVYDDNQYVATAQKYLPVISQNADADDWAIRYFIAQTYIDLYTKTNDIAYLKDAKNQMIDVVNELIDEQNALSETYLANVKEITVPKDASKSEKEEIKNYNKMLKQNRETELPPISEPLHLCCELLYAIAGKMNIGDTEKQEIDKILHEEGRDLFLNLVIDGNCRFFADNTDPKITDMATSFDGAELQIPVLLVTASSKIVVSAIADGGTTTLDDWKLEEVERNGDDINSFTATYKSAKSKKFDYKKGMTISIDIFSTQGATTPDFTIKYSVVGSKVLWVFDSIDFERIS